nr:MAG TPA: hypothetical protein [Caudoviricetes sp.]
MTNRRIIGISGADICASVQHSSCAFVRVGFFLRIHVLTLLNFKNRLNMSVSF